MRKKKMDTKEEKDLPTVTDIDGTVHIVANMPKTEVEAIESDLNRILNRIIEFNKENETNGTGTAISKLKQAILFFNKEI